MFTPFLLFNDIGGGEVVLIFLIVLIFFGPKSIPGIAKTIGRAIYSIRNASDELKEEIKKAGVDVKKDLNIDAIISQKDEIEQPLDQAFTGIDNTVHFKSETQQVIAQQTPKEKELISDEESKDHLSENKIKVTNSEEHDT